MQVDTEISLPQLRRHLVPTGYLKQPIVCSKVGENPFISLSYGLLTHCSANMNSKLKASRKRAKVDDDSQEVDESQSPRANKDESFDLVNIQQLSAFDAAGNFAQPHLIAHLFDTLDMKRPASLAPLYVTYPKLGRSVDFGTQVSQEIVANAPFISLFFPSKVEPYDLPKMPSNELYTLISFDPDMPSPRKNNEKSYIHWLVTNIDFSSAVCSQNAGAKLFSIEPSSTQQRKSSANKAGSEQGTLSKAIAQESDIGTTVFPYEGPQPLYGNHRIAFMICRQESSSLGPATQNSGEISMEREAVEAPWSSIDHNSTRNTRDRQIFVELSSRKKICLQSLLHKYSLTPIAANFFCIHKS